jgi:AbrB family looped-hinge helix DNA binding protein
MRFVRKINERGTLTIPSEVREVLDLKDGDIVDVQIVRVVGRGKKAFPGEVAQ